MVHRLAGEMCIRDSILDPDLQTAGVRVDLADHAAAQILLGVFAKADIAGLGVAQRPAVGLSLIHI